MRRKRTPKQGNLLPIVLIIAGAALVLGLLIWQAVLSVTTASAPAAPAAATPAAQQAANQNIPAPEIERVTLEDSKTALDNQQAVFLDVRDPISFANGHIPGSINIPLNELQARAGELDPNDWIITYCT
jgi:3-mercaptopyruvate sulfurtransferase SseA